MAIKKWCILYTPYFETPFIKSKGEEKIPKGKERGNFPAGTVIDVTKDKIKKVNKDNTITLWSEVEFTDRENKEWIVFVQDVYLEDLIENPKYKGKNPDFNPIPENLQSTCSIDAAQFLDWEGEKKTQLCGPLCVAYIVKEKIDELLIAWKIYDGGSYSNTVTKNNGLGYLSVRSMLKMRGYHNEDFKNTDKLTIDFLSKMLNKYFLIAGVTIDKITGNPDGELGNGTAKHWVVLDKITSEGDRGWVDIYNPFPNKLQEYSYHDFIRAFKTRWDATWVTRTPPVT